MDPPGSTVFIVLVAFLFGLLGYLAGYGRGEIDMRKRVEEERAEALRSIKPGLWSDPGNTRI
jgi:hypothetical protein